MSGEARMRELALELPPAPRAMGRYLPAVSHGDLLYVVGTGPLRPDGPVTSTA
jgi:enamine deaminase RidA (YjgF/YER057c/UK114 family)